MQLFKQIKIAIFVAVVAATKVYAVDPNAEDLINFQITEKGVYQVTHAQLMQEGLDIAGEPLTRIALMNKGQAVQIELQGSTADAAVFGDGASIRFVGHGIDTLYTDVNVYTLRLDSEAHRIINPDTTTVSSNGAYASSYLATKTFSPQTRYSFASPDKDDPWYAESVLALNQQGSTSIDLDLSDYSPGGNSGLTTAKMKVNVWGGTDLPGISDDHHVRISFNGQQIIDETFEGLSSKEMSAPVQNLRVGNNRVGITLPLDMGYDFDVVNVDSVTISYPRSFRAENDQLIFKSTFRKFLLTRFTNTDIAVYRQSPDGQTFRMTNVQAAGSCNPSRPRCAASFAGSGQLAEYFAFTENSVQQPIMMPLPLADVDIKSGSADYLIIAHPDFIADPDLGEGDLLGDLASELAGSFNGADVVDVEQIYAQFGDHIFDPKAIQDYIKYAVENRGTSHVLLVGGDVFDYRGFLNEDAQSFIPSIYTSTDDLINFAPVDAKYADLDDDNIPDVPIGRLPVRDVDELEILLAKRTAYLNRNYNLKAVFAADAFDDIQQYSFQLDAQTVQQDFFDDWDVATAFVDEDGVAGARANIISGINTGVSLTSFFGHSSTAQWSFSGLFDGNDASNLNNIDKPTIVTQWGCWNTYYVNPNEDSMGHRFMMEGNRGAVAVMGATTLTSALNEKALARLVFARLTNGETLGEAITNAKKEFAQQYPEALDVILGWTLLGPPELKL